MSASLKLNLNQVIELVSQLGKDEQRELLEMLEKSAAPKKKTANGKKSEFFENIEKLKLRLPKNYRFDRDEIHDR